MNLAAGQTLLQYCLIEKFGEGGMGLVWKAQDTTLGREVRVSVRGGNSPRWSPTRKLLTFRSLSNEQYLHVEYDNADGVFRPSASRHAFPTATGSGMLFYLEYSPDGESVLGRRLGVAR